MPSVTRRTFVIAAASGLATARLRLANAQVAPSDRIRLGVVGYGSRGTGNLAEFLRNPEVECAVICDVDDAHAAKGAANVESQRGNKPDTHRDFRRVLDRKDIDALLVSTPDHWHALPTVFGCQTGRDVYVEKPFARTVEEGRAIVTAAQANKSIVQMGTQWRSAQHYADAAAYVQSGKLGSIRSIRAWCYKTWDIQPQSDCPVPQGVDYDLWTGPCPERAFNPNRFHRNFRWYWDYAGGLATDLGVHVINFCQWATGLEWPTRIASAGSSNVLGTITETPDTQTVLYQFPHYTLTWEHQLQGTIGPHNADSGAAFSGAHGTLIASAGGWEVIPDPSVRAVLEAEKHEASPDGRAAHVRNFLDCIKSREQPVSNPEVGHHVTAIAHLGNIAYRVKDEIEWDAESERITNSKAADALLFAGYRSPWSLPSAY
ncbi:MAG: dehydrogenase [Candidatus Hydrogenedentota bacterium]